MPRYPDLRRCALVIAHPGHELRVHHWMEVNKPIVLVLTDGSGRTEHSRIPSTDRILAMTGARRGPLFGRYSDQEMYRRLLAVDAPFFVGLAEEVAGVLEHGAIDYVASDAAEGFNTSHDLCQYIVEAAVEKVRRRTGRLVEWHQFLLVGRPDACPEATAGAATWLHLDDAAQTRKIAAAQSYPEIATEVAWAVKSYGMAPFAVECLQPAGMPPLESGEAEPRPYYEIHGEKQKAAGVYSEVICGEKHVEPLHRALLDWARSDS